MHKPWILEHAPTTTSEVLVDPSLIQKVVSYIENFKNVKKKGLILYGKTGVGKTTLTYAIAEERNMELLEINASDKRNKGTLQELLGNATKQMSLFGTSKIILVDEIDGLSGVHDRGGASELATIIKESAFPIIMTAEDPWSSKFSKLRSQSSLLEVKQQSPDMIKTVLQKIADKEGVSAEDEALRFISRMSNGDIRAAINDFQSSISGNAVKRENLNDEHQRDITSSIPQALQTVFKSKEFNVLKEAFSNFQGNFDDLFLWVDYNLPKEYDVEDLAEAYEYLSMADIYNGRIRRWQYWRFLVYINLFMSAGIGMSKEEAAKKFIKYQQSSRILKMWMAKRKYAKRDAIAEKIAKKTHWSTSQVKKNFEFYKTMCKDKEFLKAFSEEIKLEKDEKEWLRS
jgi:replication factor C large subunit